MSTKQTLAFDKLLERTPAKTISFWWSSHRILAFDYMHSLYWRLFTKELIPNLLSISSESLNVDLSANSPHFLIAGCQLLVAFCWNLTVPANNNINLISSRSWTTAEQLIAWPTLGILFFFLWTRPNSFEICSHWLHWSASSKLGSLQSWWSPQRSLVNGF